MASLVPSLRASSTRLARPAARTFASTSRAPAEPSAEASPTPSSSSSSSSSSQPTATDATAADTGALDAAATAQPPSSGTGTTKKGYRAWLAGEGQRFRKPVPGRTNWIADTPFPLNPTFNPLPPLADSIKSKIYNSYLHNILLKDATDSQVVRAVSTRFGVSMDRVRAIIRLKELEKQWKAEGRALQTELVKGMESHLGVKQVSDNWRGVELPDPAKPQLASSKTVFEMVDVESGDSPVFLPLLSRIPLRATPLTAPPASSSNPPPSSSSTTSSTSTTASTSPRAKQLTVPASRAGRAPLVFTDLSGTPQGRRLEQSYDQGKTKRGNKAKAGGARGERAQAQAQASA
ncbi:hypothetical protein JCM9279_001076 [Rhodotorula babjevae]